MSSPSTPPWSVPMWLKFAGSVVALGHLFAIVVLALSARNGPWPTPFGGSDYQVGPRFATSIAEKTDAIYLRWLRMTHNYHFMSNQVGMNAVSFEARLKDEQGQVFHTLKFPDDKANFWVRHRQSILARGLGNDQPVQQSGTELLPAVGKGLEEVNIWRMTEPGVLKLQSVPKGLAQKDRSSMQPSELSMVLAQSYGRHLCREHNAASVELIRHHRDHIMPAFWFIPANPPEEAFTTTKSHFGEFRRDK